MSEITHVHARQILSSRAAARASRSHHARVGGVRSRRRSAGRVHWRARGGRAARRRRRIRRQGVMTAVQNINGEIATAPTAATAMRPADHRPLDRALIELDGTEKKKRLGANAILGLSMAAARARAAEYQGPCVLEPSTPRARIVWSSSLTGPVKPAPALDPLANDNHSHRRPGAQLSAQWMLERTIRKEENPAGMRDCRWRDPDSNRGHHDFQSWAEIPPTAAKVLQLGGFASSTVPRAMFAGCVRLPRVWAPRRVSVPNRWRHSSRRPSVKVGRSTNDTPISSPPHQNSAGGRRSRGSAASGFLLGLRGPAACVNALTVADAM
jgi:hypothetical protein